MRGIKAAFAFALLLAACGQPSSESADQVPEPGISICQHFIDATAELDELTDYDAYVEGLNEAALPLYQQLVGGDYDVPEQVFLSWETLAYGSPSGGAFEAVHHFGGLLVPEFGPTCEELGRNLGAMPLSPEATPSEAPLVEIRPLYEEGTLDYACDVFIQTLFAWSDERSSGIEIGSHIADLTDRLIVDVESHGIEDGVDGLRAYSEKYRTVPIIRAHEEAEQLLRTASQDLAEHSMVCGHLSFAGHDPDVRPGDLDYHQHRWEALGYDSYTLRLAIAKPRDVRGGQELIVVVRNGELEEVYDIRTGDKIKPPAGAPLTVSEMFDHAASGGQSNVWFHPVLGYPDIGIRDLNEGIDFDRSVLGSTADAEATVGVVDEFIPGQRCGPARVPGGRPIPPTEPLDDDASPALDALRTAEEDGRFSSTYDYQIFERTRDQLVLLGEDSAANFAFAEFVREDDRWSVTSWGTCHWEDDGYGLARWFVDPEVSHDRNSNEIHLVAADECAAHTRFGNEYVVVATTTEETIQLEIWRADEPLPPPEGPEYMTTDCPLGYVVKLTVLLDEPIGDRELAGATDPEDWPEDLVP